MADRKININDITGPVNAASAGQKDSLIAALGITAALTDGRKLAAGTWQDVSADAAGLITLVAASVLAKWNTAVAALSDATKRATITAAKGIASSSNYVHSAGAILAADANTNEATLVATQPFDPNTITLSSKSAAYTAVLADAGTGLLHPAADTTARIWTIPANASVAFPIGTVLMFINQNAGGVITIAITTDTMRLAGSGATGSRTLAANGIATATKITATEWIIAGTGLT